MQGRYGQVAEIKGPSPYRTWIIILAVVALVAVVVLIAVVAGGQNAGQATSILNAMPSYNIQAFGENVLYYDGATLVCVGNNGSTKWQYTLGSSGDFSCNGTAVAAWSGAQLHVLNKDGQVTFTDRMDGTIQFARIGEAYVATCFGDALSSKVRVTSHTGTLLGDYTFDDLYMMDIGFFYTGNRYMWVLGLDTNGTAPISSLTTYEPGKMDTGGVEIQDNLVYRVYAHNNLLMVADTTKVTPYNYKAVEQTELASILAYGWQIRQVYIGGRSTTHALLQPPPSTGDGSTFSEIRLITNHKAQSLRLPAPCFASGLSQKGVYAFSAGSIYFAPYGATSFKATPVKFTMGKLLCMLENNRAVIASGNDVMIVELPTR